jgi:hypothetical protein
VEERTVVAADENVLDGSQSNDPDAPADPRTLQYQWSCRDHQNDDRPCTFAEGADDPTQSPSARTSRLVLPAGSLLDRTRYEFVLRVFKRDSPFDRDARLAEDFTRITVGRSATPLVTIEAPAAVNVHAVTKIRARAFSNHPPMSYRWRISRTRDAAGASDQELSSLRVERPFVSIQPFVLNPESEYEARITATDSRPAASGGPASGTGSLRLVPNAPPRLAGAEPSFSPEAGTEFNTTFALDCGAWEDEDEPVRVSVLFRDYRGRWTPLRTGLPAGESIGGLLLPKGYAASDGKLEVVCRAEDSRGGRAERLVRLAVSESPDIESLVMRVFRAGAHLANLEVFPAALRRLEEAEIARYARRRVLQGTASGSGSASFREALGLFSSAFDRSQPEDPSSIEAAAVAADSALAVEAVAPGTVDSQEL